MVTVWLAQIDIDPYEPLTTIGVYSTEDRAAQAIINHVTNTPQYYVWRAVITEWELDKEE